MRKLNNDERMAAGDKVYEKDGSQWGVINGLAGNRVGGMAAVQMGGWVIRPVEEAEIDYDGIYSALDSIRKEIKQWKND